MPDEIAYQNKDITSKLLGEMLAGKSLNVYGLDLPRVRRVLPTNLPVIFANELRLDNLFELEDDSIALIDYESAYHDADKITYGQYMMRVAEWFRRDGLPIPTIRLIIIYTADVERRQVQSIMDRGGFAIRMTPAFLSELDSETIRARLTAKVEQRIPLDEEEAMQFIILPLSYRDKGKKLEVLQESVSLAERIDDAATSRFILSGLVVFSDKIIDSQTRERAWRAIKMTQIGKMFLDEMEEQVAKARKEVTEQMTEQMAQQAEQAEQKVKQAEQKAEQASAKTLRLLIESLVQNRSVAIEEACQMLGISVTDYENAVLLARSGDAA